MFHKKKEIFWYISLWPSSKCVTEKKKRKKTTTLFEAPCKAAVRTGNALERLFYDTPELKMAIVINRVITSISRGMTPMKPIYKAI